jgi:hypothetical protein
MDLHKHFLSREKKTYMLRIPHSKTGKPISQKNIVENLCEDPFATSTFGRHYDLEWRECQSREWIFTKVFFPMNHSYVHYIYTHTWSLNLGILDPYI